MPVILATTRQPLDANQQGSLRKLFDSPEFSLLKEVVSARCIDHQVQVINAALYPKNEAAVDDVGDHSAKAILLNDLLDLLDDLEKQEQEWCRIKVEPRH